MSSTDFLKRLYWPCSEECGNYATGYNLGELYRRTKETAQASARMNNLLDCFALDKNAANQLTSLCCEIMNAYEQQGFINGLRMGAQLARELMPATETIEAIRSTQKQKRETK